MSARIWLETTTGLPGSQKRPGNRRFPGFAHAFLDVTERPAETVIAARPQNVIIEYLPGTEPVQPTEKPPYRVPLMAEIRAAEPNGFTVASTFSGGGGSSTGYRMAGFRVVYANEFVEAGRETYRANMAPYTVLDDRDIRTVTAESILELTGLKRGELDLFDGSPPCSAFSTAGKREAGWGSAKKYSDDKVQRVDDLFFEFARLLEGLQPKAFIAENVSGLVKGSAKGYFIQILARLKACGYRVEAKVLDAQWLGVPQSRQRLIFSGVRNDLGLAPAFPKPLPYRYSVRDALPWITRAVHDTSGAFSAGEFTNKPCPAITVGGLQSNACHYKVEGDTVPEGAILLGDPKWKNKPGNSFPRGVRIPFTDPCPTVLASTGMIGGVPHFLENAAPPVEPEASLDGYAIGEEWDRLSIGEKSERYFNMYRTGPDEPAPTVTARGAAAGAAGITHPTERRKFSIAELRRICSFPDDFVLHGTYAQQWERCGRAVPPVMMSHIAAAVRDQVLRKL